MTVHQLCIEVRAAEKRLEADLHLMLFADGSGDVMAPMRDYSAAGERTDDTGFESVYEFHSINELVVWLREGKLPEDMA